VTRRHFAKRQARIAAGHCPRCDKPVRPWPLRRADVCHVAGAAVCGRQWVDIINAETQLEVKEHAVVHPAQD
jgi:hypothetical protein